VLYTAKSGQMCFQAYIVIYVIKYKVYLNRAITHPPCRENKYLRILKFARTIRLLLTFYRGFFILSFLITLVCGVLFGEYGRSIFFTVLALKLGSMTLIFFFIRTSKSREFIYYQNLGLPRTFLWTTTLLFDFFLYLLLLSLVHSCLR